MKTPQWVVPALVVLFAALGIGGARLLAIPSVVRDFTVAGSGPLRMTVLVVDGVKCVDTAEGAADQLKEVPGVVRLVAYASRNRVEVTFHPGATDVTKIKDAIEGPVYDEASKEYHFGVYKVVEVDGGEVSH
jgi:copper chaperone CopZ